MRSFMALGDINKEMAEDFFNWAIDCQINPMVVGEHPEVVISSRGGDIGFVVGIYDGILLRRAKTVAMGILETSAAVLFQAGSTRVMSPNSLLRFQEPPRDEASKDFTDYNWFLFTKLVALVQSRIGLSLIETHDLFDGNFINANRAKELGLCDEIQGEENGTTDRVQVSEGSNSRNAEQLPGDNISVNGPVVGS